MTMDTDLQQARRLAAACPGDFELRARVRALERRSGARMTFSPERERPDHHPDLEQFDSLDEAGLSYEFHLLAAWLHKPTGRVFWGEDSGCSCPSPWENDGLQFNGETFDTTLTEITPASFADFKARVEGFPAPIDERIGFADKVEAVWRAGLDDQATRPREAP